MNVLRTSYHHPATLAAKSLWLCIAVLCAASAFAQQDTMSPYQGEQDGVSAGGKWLQFDSENKMTGAKRVRFQLLAENYFKEDPNYKPRVELICEDGKYKVSTFTPAVRIGPNRPGFWGQPQLEVETRIDDIHNYHGWNWQGRFLTMDKGTARGILQANVFNIAIPTRSGRQIAEFQPDGLDVSEVKKACDLTPKKPSKD